MFRFATRLHTLTRYRPLASTASSARSSSRRCWAGGQVDIGVVMACSCFAANRLAKPAVALQGRSGESGFVIAFVIRAFQHSAIHLTSSRGRRARRSSRPGSRSRFAALCIVALGNMQPSQQMCRQLLGELAPRRRAARSRRRLTMSSLPLGSSGRQCRPVLSCEPVPCTVASFWATWKSIVQGRRAAVSLLQRVVEPSAVSFQSKFSRQDRVFRRVVAQQVEQRVGHVGLKAERLGPVDHFQKLHHPPPTVHAAPADFSFGGQPLAEILGDRRRPGETCRRSVCCWRSDRPCDQSCHARRPSRSARRRRAGRPVRAAAWRCGSPCGPASETACRSSSVPIAEPPPVGGQTGATTEPITRLRLADLVGQPLQIVVRGVDVDVRREQKQIEAVELARRRLRRRPSGRASCPDRSAARNRALCRPRPARPRCEASGNCSCAWLAHACVLAECRLRGIVDESVADRAAAYAEPPATERPHGERLL